LHAELHPKQGLWRDIFLYDRNEQSHQLLSGQENAETLYKAIKWVQKRKPFELLAYCIMPDHFHLLLSLLEEDDSFSQKIREIKRLTTFTLRKSLGVPDLVIWRDRFWEHTIRDENDLTNCFNYIHYNPVHHQLIESPEQWK